MVLAINFIGCLNLHSAGVVTVSLFQMCKRYPGFLRVAIADPQPERRWFRRGWVTFERQVNIKEICWNLNNIRVSYIIGPLVFMNVVPDLVYQRPAQFKFKNVIRLNFTVTRKGFECRHHNKNHFFQYSCVCKNITFCTA